MPEAPLPTPLLPESLPPTRDALIQRIEALEARLEESEGTLEAIRRGEIDALVVGGTPEEPRIYTLESADRPYRVLIEQIQEGTLTLGADGLVLYCNRRLAGMLGLPQERLIGQSLRPFVIEQDRASFDRMLETATRGGTREEITLRSRSGEVLPVYMSLSLLQQEGNATLLCGVLTDLTEQKLHLGELSAAHARLVEEIAERERIEDALRQSQKMEAVGQLTGGLAHDFNNLLTGITGSLELLQTRMAQGRIGDLDRYLVAAQGASRRAAALTHRLLAFSRRQTLDPRPTEINRLVGDMEELIRRTVEAAVRIDVICAPDLWVTLVDANQLENALLNLCINARDAMPDGGRLIIETENQCLDERSARTRDLSPGDYVSLCVTDTGAGMTPEVVRRAVEPFFTTKPIGLGTGLGLSMIYGFVQQSGGQVRIDSEPGRGTAVRLYLPRHHGVADADAHPPPRDASPSGGQGETVLVVDDEPTVRMLVAETLEDLGYSALEAADGPAGLRILQSGARIDLLVTDVGLPGGMNGRQLADIGRLARPRLKVLFITGYAEKAVLGKGILEAGMHLLTKPFAMETLATRIRDIIASG